MTREDWSGGLYTGPTLPPGFRIRICESGEAQDPPSRHWCGNVGDGTGTGVSCPNCGRMMFNVFDIDMTEALVASLGIWSRERLVVRVCPTCSLYFKPFWVIEGDAPRVVGGERDGGRILQDVRPPYPRRALELVPLADADGEIRAVNVGRTRADGTPVSREVAAIEDLEAACVPVEFVPYDR